MSRVVVVAAAVVALVACVSVGAGATWTVEGSGGADFVRIQDAINAASDYDEIVVKPGTYKEHLIVDKQITLKGENYPIVDGEWTGNVIWIKENGVCIEGLKVVHTGKIEECYSKYGIITASQCVIDDCIFNECDIAVSVCGSGSLVAGSTFEDNRIGLVICEANDNTVENNHFVNGGMILDKATNNLIKNNTIESDPYFGINIYNECDGNTIVENTLQYNSMGAIEIADSCWGTTSHNNVIYYNNIIDNGGSW